MIYSVRLFAGSFSTTLASLYTAPANSVIDIRDVELYNNSGAADHADVAIDVSGFGLVQFIGTASVPNGQSVQWKGRVILAPGDIIQAFSGAGTWLAYISGYSFT